MKRALAYIRKNYPFWNASGGADHIFMMLHDEGPCFAPRELRSSILLTHYGYWSLTPRPWGTYYDDNFMQDPRFYARHLGDPSKPTAHASYLDTRPCIRVCCFPQLVRYSSARQQLTHTTKRRVDAEVRHFFFYPALQLCYPAQRPDALFLP